MRCLSALLAVALALGAAATAQEAPVPGAKPQAMALVTTRAIRAKALLGPDDVVLEARAVPGALTSPEAAIGLETRNWLQAGHPITEDDLAPPALVERNQLVTLRFRQGMLEITTDGRALERAAAGDPVRVMNLSSRATVTGRAVAPGIVEVR